MLPIRTACQDCNPKLTNSKPASQLESLSMIRSTSILRSCFGATAALALLAPVGGFAQNAPDRSIDQFTCKQVMREPAAARETSIAFLHGYLLGKSSSMKFNVEALLKRTDKFIDSCLDNPSARAIDIMTKMGS